MRPLRRGAHAIAAGGVFETEQLLGGGTVPAVLFVEAEPVLGGDGAAKAHAHYVGGAGSGRVDIVILHDAAIEGSREVLQ